ncbi:MAG: hypothetical protein IJ647_02960 [Prevotella sp.]|nr:hypothetical protein [Prevotella sp.]
MRIIETKGNQKLMDREKTLFLCSKRTPIGLYEKVFQWTDSLTKNDCIACFNSTEMEKEVLLALLMARIPTILFVMNRFTDVNNIQIEQALREGRMLIVVLKRDEPKGKGMTPRLRNEFVLSTVQHVICGYIKTNGSIFPLLAGRKDAKKLVKESNMTMIAAESDMKHERWTVAQDKTLLRMFYADMGIHAIHKQLHRSYLAIYTRIRSITQSEEVLKGREFEDYVLSLFNIKEDGPLVLQEWQGDKSLGLLSPESNSHPDFVFRYDQQEFAVECKWREKISKELSKDVFTEKGIENYKKFSADRNMPVTIVLGVGGEPCNPELLYAIPLNTISAILSQSRPITDFLVSTENLDVTKFLPLPSTSETKTYTLADKRKEFPNAYKPWSKTDDDELLKLYHQGMSLNELSAKFERKRSAILSRIRKLTSTL